MKLVTAAGPPSCGKTAVLSKALVHCREAGFSPAVVKFDCLFSKDAALYEAHGIPVSVVLSGSLCPDHFFATNLEETLAWAGGAGADLLVMETAGLCNRCSPHILGVLGLCVIDNLMGIDAPAKIGPMLRLADMVVVTKGDMVSQAEREVYRHRIRQMNKTAVIRHVNGLTGQGCKELGAVLAGAPEVESIVEKRLRFPMPAAVCSYCLSETRIGEKYQKGNVKKARFSPHAA